MLLLLVSAIVLASVPLAGGRLGRVADVRVRGAWTLAAALGIQLAILEVVPSGMPFVHQAAHLLSYVLAGAFVVANRRVPGMVLVGLGGALNATAIFVNDGVMPAAPGALRTAGMATQHDGFLNSAAVQHPHLGFLGDVFAVPASWPAANVFSVGDVLLVLGLAVGLHVICASRLVPKRDGDLAALRRAPDFVRLWGAQAVSNLGDWIYALAVATTIAERPGAARILPLLLIAQFGPSAVVSLLGGSLVDRFSRKRIMLASDALRALAVGSLLLTDHPSVGHLVGVAVCLGLFGALFQPSLQATLPNVVPAERLVAANALLGATLNLAIMIGPVLGALLATGLGAEVAFAVNAASFAVSGALIAFTRLPHRRRSTESVAAPLREIGEGLRHVVGVRLIRGIMIVIGVVIFGAAIKSPTEPLFVLRTLHASPAVLGLAGTVWGLGMVLGSCLAPAFARRWRREALLAGSIAIVGAAILGAAATLAVLPMLALWLVAGGGNAVGTVAYETMLQEQTPDALRGRVIAASEAVIDVAWLLGAVAAGVIAGALGARGAYVICGVIFLAAAVAARVLLGPVRRSRWHTAFQLVSFEHVPADGRLALLRLAGRWSGEGLPTLLVDDGARVHRLDPLPQPESPGPVVRAGFGVPAALLQRPDSVFALEVTPGRTMPLPPPVLRPRRPLASV